MIAYRKRMSAVGLPELDKKIDNDRFSRSFQIITFDRTVGFARHWNSAIPKPKKAKVGERARASSLHVDPVINKTKFQIPIPNDRYLFCIYTRLYM